MNKVVVDDLRFDSPSGRFRREDGLFFDLAHHQELDLWRRNDGAEYVKNLSRISDPVLVRVDADIWRSRYNGAIKSFDWTSISLGSALLADFRAVAVERLRRRSTSEISTLGNLLRSLEKITAFRELPIDSGIDQIQTQDLVNALSVLPTDKASFLRSVYGDMAFLQNGPGISERHELLSQIRLTKNRQTLDAVLAWDPREGALTTAELEQLRRNLGPPFIEESDTEHFARVMLRTLVALGRRPSQLLGVRSDGIRKCEKDARLPAVILVPGAKHQINDPPRPYDLPDDLFDDLVRFSRRPDVHDAQEHFGHFFVTPLKTQSRVAGPRNTAATNTRLQDWIQRKGILSPRTGEPMHVTPTRLRHTVATQLMRKGWDLADIREFLEHRSDTAVLAYLDAVGSDLAPALERADRALGGLFSQMTGHFLGSVVARPAGKIEKPIVVPSVGNRAVIGRCGYAAACPKSPFSACLSGCEYFLFFKDADVAAARKHIAEEHDRWRAAEPSAQRARAHDDFARMERGLLEAKEIAEKMDD